MVRLTPYLSFKGNCREAMEFYQRCLGGNLDLQTYGDSPMGAEMPDEVKGNVLHSMLVAEGIVLMASDDPRPGSQSRGEGVALCINAGDQAQTRTYFENLSEGANVTMPLKEEFFGTFGALIDKFGVGWMFQVEPAEMGE